MAGKILGIEIGEDSIEKLTQKIVAVTDPKVYPEILVRDVDKRKVVIIKVNESRNKPHLAFNKAFKRVGKSTVQLSRDELEKLILDKYKEKIIFDLQVSAANFGELDKNKIREFVGVANKERNLKIRFTNVKDVLDKLGLLRRSKILNPTILLFGKNPQKYFSPAVVRCARFRGKETTEFIDMKVFSGTLDEQIENSLGFVMNHVKRKIRIEGAKRKEEWEYPISAVREAITNAVCHRDYFSTASVQVSVLDDRVEIWNPGKLPEELNIKKLKEKHRSIPRNPLIAKVLFLYGYIEQWGTGTNRIINECIRNSLPEPVFREEDNSFSVVLKSKDILLEELNERQVELINYLKRKGDVTRKGYEELSKVSERTARFDLEMLVKKGLITKISKGKLTRYKLV